MKKRNPYTTLGLSYESTGDEIKTKFRKLSREWHPDINKSEDATEIFAEISEAYETLSDPKKREELDKQLAHGGVESIDEAVKSAVEAYLEKL